MLGRVTGNRYRLVAQLILYRGICPNTCDVQVQIGIRNDQDQTPGKTFGGQERSVEAREVIDGLEKPGE